MAFLEFGAQKFQPYFYINPALVLNLSNPLAVQNMVLIQLKIKIVDQFNLQMDHDVLPLNYLHYFVRFHLKVLAALDYQ